jgi:BASS family bile acid:Na+ symporter
MKQIEQISAFTCRYFSVWVIAASVIGWVHPNTFLFALPHIRLALGIIMFGMGMTLSLRDFKRVLVRPRAVFAGVVLQFTIMPAAAYGIAQMLNLPPLLAVGLVLVGACPGGTASNVISYLARGDVALSVTMTSVSTILAPLLTPLITLWLAGHWMPVPAGKLFLTILQIVIIPVILGLSAHHLFPQTVKHGTRVLPVVSIVFIVIIVGAVIGRNVDDLRTAGLSIFLAVILHNGFGLLLGFALAAALRLPRNQCRTVSVEVGMQNSGLAVALATAHIAPLAAVPGAFFSVWHNITGPLLASYWSRHPSSAGQDSLPTP